jgi:hypothetical protein
MNLASFARDRARPRAAPWCGVAVAIALGASATGCAPKCLYGWGRYEESLKASYIQHDDAAAWSNLEATLMSAHESGTRIPPGACAEFAFLLYKRGERDRAIEYFEREAQLFVESKPLMDRLIAKVREQTGPTAAREMAR